MTRLSTRSDGTDELSMACTRSIRKRCERDGLEVEIMFLDEESIEPDEGAPVPIEQPTRIITPPLSKKDQDDRVRMALGLTHDDPLPEVSQETLFTYHRYLMGNLKFPFNAFFGEEEIGPVSRKRTAMTVTGLLDPAEDRPIEEEGLICLGRDRGEEVVFPLGEVEVERKTRTPGWSLTTPTGSITGLPNQRATTAGNCSGKTSISLRASKSLGFHQVDPHLWNGRRHPGIINRGGSPDDPRCRTGSDDRGHPSDIDRHGFSWAGTASFSER